MVDGEVGRFGFTTYRVEVEGKLIYNSVGGLFPTLSGRQRYITRGFKQIAFLHGTIEDSYRKTAELINRVRHQKGATPLRTLQEQSEAEGKAIAKKLKKKADRILREQEFDSKRKRRGRLRKYGSKRARLINKKKVAKAIKAISECAQSKSIVKQMQANPVCYENTQETVNISIDDVGVKRQKEARTKENAQENAQENPNEVKDKSEIKYVHNTVVHLQTGESQYSFAAQGLETTLRILIAFLFSNNLVDKNLLFFLDGQKTLQASVVKAFSRFRQVQLILDWYHLDKKCKEGLSLAIKGRKLRNQALEQLMPLLWDGRVSEAISYLRTIKTSWVKNRDELEKLIGHLERNRPFIPCYSVRKKLGLRNSSNRGEKQNDLLVSERQKHNGMSWSKPGSLALASITALDRNNEADKWFTKGLIGFKLAA